jgi:hypothetical protein
MKFKIPKEQLINNMANEARFGAHDEICNAVLYENHNTGGGLAGALANAVSRGVEEGVRRAMREFFAQENTDDDFERDLNLK